jgi:hypothetical protein
VDPKGFEPTSIPDAVRERLTEESLPD